MRTLGGFVMTLLGRVAKVGDVVQWDGVRAEVAAVDGRRVERVIVTKVPEATADGAPQATEEQIARPSST